MRKYLVLERINDSSNVAIYSPVFDGDTMSEFEKFITKYQDTTDFQEDLGIILARIKYIEQNGVLDRYFRYESKRTENIKALPSNIEHTKLRLYCICFNEHLLILGNGGEKTTRTYQEDPVLNKYVEDLRKINQQLRWEIQNGRIAINDASLDGDLHFYFNE
ncbi:MAG: hypothetical protein ACI4BD_07010 [Paludibacteraceae bacterium]